MAHFSDDNSERTYHQEQTEFFHKRILLGSLWGIFFYPLFALLDFLVYPDHFWEFVLLRSIAVGVIVLGFLLSYLKWGRRFPQVIAISQYLVLSFSILLMIHIADGYRSPYYVGVVLTLFSILFIYPLSLSSSLVVTLVVLLGYVVPILALGSIEEPVVFITNTTFLSGIIIFINVSVKLAENMRRQEFLTRHNLAEANEELKNLDRLKTQFFANVSHEIRTPLTSIIAPLLSLSQGDVGELSTDQNELLKQMHRNAVRLLDMINQMLDFSKLEAGKVTLRLASVNLVEYTKDIISLFQEVVNRKGLDLVFEFTKGAENEVFIDRDRYERIVSNLVRNAVKFTETGGITIEMKSTRNKIILTVSDTGIGISQDYVGQIFRRFEQVDGGGGTQPYDGTGLGLAIVQESVELMHGSVEATSVVDMGTVFTVTIPSNLTDLEPDAFIERRAENRRCSHANFYRDGNDRRYVDRRSMDNSSVPISDIILFEGLPYEPVEEESRDSTQVPTGRRILLAEDTPDLRNYMLKILNKMGHDVVSAENGLIALEKLKEDKTINLLVTDLMMPKMDGYGLLQAVRKDTDFEDLPVIMITAKAGEDPKLKALGIGADDYLPKPISMRELDARIRNLLTSRDLRRSAAETAILNQRIDELRMSFAQSLDMRDAETGTHGKEVLDIGICIAEELGMPVDQTLKDSLLLHDIGKIGISDSILLKTGPLTEEEMAVMQQHPEFGKKLLENFINFREVSEIILAHQEYWNGKGYPNGLAGEEIPVIARIISVADAYHAMTNTRPYRVALSQEDAIEELKRHRGIQFDPMVVDAFLKLLDRGTLSLGS